MPRGKILYGSDNLTEEKTYYYRQTPDVYGKSKIWLEPLESHDNVLNIDNKQIWLPVLDLNKYYKGAKTYAFIEKFEEYPVTMIDLLYTYEDIIPKLDNSDIFLDNFLNQFCRKNINYLTSNSPGLLLMPENSYSQQIFADAARSSIPLSIKDSKFPLIEHSFKEEKEVIDESYDYKNAKKDGIVLEFLKDFYEILSNEKIVRANEPRKKKVTNIISRKAIIMKSGSTIIGDNVVGKYCFAYHTNVKDITRILTCYLAGFDEDNLVLSGADASEERLKKFGDTIFESNILEALMYVSTKKKSKSLFSGRYIEETGKLEVDRYIEDYFNRFNKLLGKKHETNEARSR